MDQKPKVALKTTTKPSKLMALIALVIAFALPFILVKSFPHKQLSNYEKEKEQFETIIPKIKFNTATEAQISPIKEVASVKNVPPVSHPLVLSNSQVEKNKSLAPSLKNNSTQVEQSNTLKTILTRRKETLASVFARIGLSRQLLQKINRDNPKIRLLTRLRSNEKLQYIIKNHNLETMQIPYTDTQSLILYRVGQHYKTRLNNYKLTTRNHYITAIVRGSLYTTARRHNIPYKLIQQMTEIFAWDINFARDVRANDQFTIIYKTSYANDKIIKTGEIVALSYRNRGKTFQAVLHRDRRGHSDYYNPKGSSLKNAFNRYPLRFSHISSPYSLARNHPILRYKRPHYGVDLAAPIGTPILATGDGRIEIIGRQSGYGNMIKIKHNNKFSTIYGHMLKFQKGLSKNTFIKKGQVIGYVGQSGLASGPHCHYEFHINQNPKNPTTVELPRGESIPQREMASFKANAMNYLSLLKQYESTAFAKSNQKKTKIG